MSYDIYLFEVKEGENALKKAESILTSESEELNLGEPDQDKEKRKQMLKFALIEKNPKLQKFDFGFEEIAKIEGISTEEAKVRFRHLELNGPEDGNGIQIMLYDDLATVTVPYWHEVEEAKKVFEEIWTYLEVIQDKAGYVIYDPQLERILKLSTDFADSLSSYARVVEHIRAGCNKGKKPWWKFWA